jgi:hemoglobin
MKKALSVLALLTCIAAANSAWAQTSTTSSNLYQAFGEKAGLTQLVEDFHARLLADARTGPHFKPVNPKHIKEQLTEQFCAVTGGPCVYKGADMKSAHSNLDVKKSDFNALVEVLQQAMDAKGVPFGTQNKLLALLAPMHRDVITVD